MRSLQSHLGVWLGALLVIIFGAHVLLMSHFPRYLAEERVVTRLKHDTDSLYTRLIIKENQSPALTSGPIAGIYKKPQSGHYFQVQQKEGELRSPSLQNERLNLSNAKKAFSWKYRDNHVFHIKDSNGLPLLAWVTQVEKNGQKLTITLAEEITDLEEDIAELKKAYFLGTSVAIILLIILQRFIIHHAIKPVDKARQELLSIEKGERQQIDQAVPSEIQPLVDELNHLLGVMGKRLERSRNATGNLAHALKTPLSVLNQLQEEPEIRGNKELYKDISDISTSIHTSINRELKRARLSGGSLPGQRFEVDKEIPQLIEVMSKVYTEKKLNITYLIPADKHYQADREDMLEILGNLLDNACKWANQSIKLSVLDQPGFVFTIEDDGKGIDQKVESILMQRGVRLDENTPGDGLGLSIVKEIIDQYEGEISFSTSVDLGGLLLTVRLPGD